ncbi:MAG: TRAP transporter permease, partial [Desulfofustis sp.]|nr:TRAP transporter permease [Desulfofustis sp.]
LYSLFSFVSTILLLIIIAGITYYGFGWIKTVAGDASIWIASGLLLIAYLALLKLACQVPELEVVKEITELPPLRKTAQAGLHFLLPIVVLMWCLIVERLSPSLSAFWATTLLMFIVLTQWPLKRWMRKSGTETFTFGRGWQELISGMVSGARNMIGIGVATSAAGIIVGTVTLTGIGLVMTEFVEFISGGNLLLILLFTAVISLLLGMGLPTTANYIVVSTLMAPVIVSLGAQNGLIMPLVAVHLFVFYFGILADDTPPVGLAAFAAAGISGGDPIRTGIQGFMYDIRTAILPFIFIYNNEILMIGIGTPFHFVQVVAGSVIAMLAFAAATQQYMLTRNRIWESLCLLLVAFTLLRPGFFWDELYPELIYEPPSKLMTIVEEMPTGAQLRLVVKGTKHDGSEITKTVQVAIGNEPTAQERLRAIGMSVLADGERMRIGMVGFGSTAERAMIRYGDEIVSVPVENERPAKQWMFVPALLLLALIWFSQRRRVQRQQAVAAA